MKITFERMRCWFEMNLGTLKTSKSLRNALKRLIACEVQTGLCLEKVEKKGEKLAFEISQVYKDLV